MYCIIGTVYCIIVTDVLHYSNWYIAVYELINFSMDNFIQRFLYFYKFADVDITRR